MRGSIRDFDRGNCGDSPSPEIQAALDFRPLPASGERCRVTSETRPKPSREARWGMGGLVGGKCAGFLARMRSRRHFVNRVAVGRIFKGWSVSINTCGALPLPLAGEGWGGGGAA